MKQEILDRIEVLIRVRYPLLVIETYEEERAEKILDEIAKRRQKKLLCWSLRRGLYPYGASLQSKKSLDENSKDPYMALDSIVEWVDPAMFVFKDFHPFLSDPGVVRRLRELSQYLKNSFKTLIFISPSFKIPMELDKEIAVIRLPLPEIRELGELLDETVHTVNQKMPSNFVDLPSQKEREGIFAIHIEKRKRDPKKFDLVKLAMTSEGFSGAEIEQSVISALFDVFEEEKDLTQDAMLQSLKETVPLSKTMGDVIEKARQWADGRARRASWQDNSSLDATRTRNLEI